VGAYFLSPGFLAIALLYFLLNIAYSIYLKHVPLIDVLMIAVFFVLRVAGRGDHRGGALLALAVCGDHLFALYIGFGKRRAELT
jgi:decaprenyl-phosphate phosphoribosyltransferase